MIERRLPYTPPLAAEALFGFLGDRTIPRVESFDGTTFRRAVRTQEAGAAVIELAALPDRDEFHLRILGGEAADPSVFVATARRLLDLDADPSVVDTALSSDPSLRPLVHATPGLRLPGTADGFELVVRAILGQQISVRAARTFAGRIAEACGTPLERPVGDVTHLFPTPERLATSAMDGLGLTTAREATLRRVADLVVSGELDLSGATDLEATRERLLADGWQVRRLDAVKQPVQKIRQRYRGRAANGETDQRHGSAFAEDHPQDRAALGSERHSNPELVRTLADREREHARDSDRGNR